LDRLYAAYPSYHTDTSTRRGFMSGALAVSVAPAAGASIGIPGRERTIAAPGFDRRLVPPMLCGVWNYATEGSSDE